MSVDLEQLPNVLTVPEAARVLRMSPRAYYYHAQRGRVPSIKLGHRVYVPKAKLLRFLGLSDQSSVNGSAADKRQRDGADDAAASL